MAISCFMATLSGVALLLLALFFTETFTESVRSIVLWSSLLMLAMVALYVGYRVYEDKQLTK
jgi:hypothetical protein